MATKKAAAGKKAAPRTAAKSGKAGAGAKSGAKAGAGSGARPRAKAKESVYDKFFGQVRREFAAVTDTLAREVDRTVDLAKKKMEEKGVIDQEKLKQMEKDLQRRMAGARERVDEVRSTIADAGKKMSSDERVQAVTDVGMHAIQGLAASLKHIAERVEGAVGEARERSQKGATMDGNEASAMRDRVVSQIEFEHPRTLACIEHVPDGRLGYTPHEKSRSFAVVAFHIYQSGLWFLGIIESGKVELGGAPPAPPPEKKSDLLAACERLHREFKNRAAALSPAALARPIEFPGMGTNPAVSYLAWHPSHLIHHRGQLTVYLRLMGAKVPAIYGDSADYPM